MSSNLVATPVTTDLVIAEERDILKDFLDSKTSVNTKRAYAKDLRRFFQDMFAEDASPEVLQQFLLLSRMDALRMVVQYQSWLAEQGLAGATINRRLAAIKSLVEYAYSLGMIDWQLPRLKRKPENKYRDTTGVNIEQMKKMMVVPDLTTIQGKRSYVILRLLCENGLRRGELANLRLSHVDFDSNQIQIYGKGQGNNALWIDVSDRALDAVAEWLKVRPETDHHFVFTALDFKNKGKPLSPTSIYRTIRGIAQEAGIKKIVSPHRIRHSAITAC
jgi:integrase/recombinase XerC